MNRLMQMDYFSVHCIYLLLFGLWKLTHESLGTLATVLEKDYEAKNIPFLPNMLENHFVLFSVI